MSNIFVNGIRITPKGEGFEVTEISHEIFDDVIEAKPEARGEKIRKELLEKLRHDVTTSQRSTEQSNGDGFTE